MGLILNAQKLWVPNKIIRTEKKKQSFLLLLSIGESHPTDIGTKFTFSAEREKKNSLISLLLAQLDKKLFCLLFVSLFVCPQFSFGKSRLKVQQSSIDYGSHIVFVVPSSGCHR